MDWFIKAFIRASLLWFAAGIVLGLGIALQPDWVVYRPAHAHMNIAGFLSMFVFGVGYQLLPRLFGHPLLSTRQAIAHFYLANIGLAGLVLGFLVRPHADFDSRWLTGTGGALFALGALLWVWNLWRTFDAADARHQERMVANRRELPTFKDLQGG
jgi:cytochrome c oxidase cbb3-type subunit 1